MNYLKIFFITIILSSCSLTPSKNITKDINKYDSKNHSQMKEYVQQLIDNHSEFDNNKKEKIKKLLIKTLNKNKELKVRESKMTQHLLELTLVKKASFKEIALLRSEMIKNYKMKIKIFEEAALELKRIVGIKNDHNQFMREAGLFFR